MCRVKPARVVYSMRAGLALKAQLLGWSQRKRRSKRTDRLERPQREPHPKRRRNTPAVSAGI
jgi:hypothetical protein